MAEGLYSIFPGQRVERTSGPLRGLPIDTSAGTDYQYDDSGNLTGINEPGGSTGDRCFFYDPLNLQRSVSIDATTGCGRSGGDRVYLSDAFDRRVVEKTDTSDGVLNYYAGTEETLVERTAFASGSITDVLASYAHSTEGPLAQKVDSDTRFFMRDLHGDTMGLVDLSGDVQGSTLFSPWGEPTGGTGEISDLGFQSQYTDADTGYVDMTTRLYDPAGGRFTSRDVLFGDTNGPASMNQYGYALGNPVTRIDLNGMISSVCCVYGNDKWKYTAHYERPADPNDRINLGAMIKLNGDSLHWHSWGKNPNCDNNALCGATVYRLSFDCRKDGLLGSDTCSNGWHDKPGAETWSGITTYYKSDWNKTFDEGTYYMNFKLSAKAPNGASISKGTFHSAVFKCSSTQCKF